MGKSKSAITQRNLYCVHNITSSNGTDTTYFWGHTNIRVILKWNEISWLLRTMYKFDLILFQKRNVCYKNHLVCIVYDLLVIAIIWWCNPRCSLSPSNMWIKIYYFLVPTNQRNFACGSNWACCRFQIKILYHHKNVLLKRETNQIFVQV